MDHQEIERRLQLLTAYMFALEGVLLAVYDRLPSTARELVCRSFLQGEDEASDLMHFENFTDAELDAFKEARQRVHALLVSRPAL